MSKGSSAFRVSLGVKRAVGRKPLEQNPSSSGLVERPPCRCKIPRNAPRRRSGSNERIGAKRGRRSRAYSSDATEHPSGPRKRNAPLRPMKLTVAPVEPSSAQRSTEYEVRASETNLNNVQPCLQPQNRNPQTNYASAVLFVWIGRSLDSKGPPSSELPTLLLFHNLRALLRSGSYPHPPLESSEERWRHMLGDLAWRGTRSNPLHVNAVVVVVLLMSALPRPPVRFLPAFLEVDPEMRAVIAPVERDPGFAEVLAGHLHLCKAKSKTSVSE